MDPFQEAPGVRTHPLPHVKKYVFITLYLAAAAAVVVAASSFLPSAAAASVTASTTVAATAVSISDAVELVMISVVSSTPPLMAVKPACCVLVEVLHLHAS